MKRDWCAKIVPPWPKCASIAPCKVRSTARLRSQVPLAAANVPAGRVMAPVSAVKVWDQVSTIPSAQVMTPYPLRGKRSCRSRVRRSRTFPSTGFNAPYQPHNTPSSSVSNPANSCGRTGSNRLACLVYCLSNSCVAAIPLGRVSNSVSTAR